MGRSNKVINFLANLLLGILQPTKVELLETNFDILETYHNMLKSKIKLNKSLFSFIDCGNASACLVAPKIFKEVGIKCKELFVDPGTLILLLKDLARMLNLIFFQIYLK